MPNQQAEAQIRDTFLGWLQEAQELRQEAAAWLPQPGALPERYAEALLQVRARQDRVETLLGEAESLRHATQRWSWDHEAVADDAFDAQVAIQKRMGRHDGDYSTGRERQAEINLLILGQMTEARAARRFHNEVDEMLSRIRIIYRGLDGTRADLGNYLRWLSWEKAMER